MPQNPPTDPKADAAKVQNLDRITALLKRATDTARKVEGDAKTAQKGMTELDKEDK